MGCGCDAGADELPTRAPPRRAQHEYSTAREYCIRRGLRVLRRYL